MRQSVSKLLRKVAVHDWPEVKLKFNLDDSQFRSFYRKLKVKYIGGNKHERREKLQEARRICFARP